MQQTVRTSSNRNLTTVMVLFFSKGLNETLAACNNKRKASSMKGNISTKSLKLINYLLSVNELEGLLVAVSAPFSCHALDSKVIPLPH